MNMTIGIRTPAKNRDGALQRLAVNSRLSDGVPSIVHEVLASPGQPLDAGTRAFMEPRFGHDFSRVRVHKDTRAAESAGAVNALAYTVGGEIVFGAEQYAPGTSAGRKLIAHELTHVVQRSQTVQAQLAISDPGDAQEQEAEHVAEQVSSGRDAGAVQTTSAGALVQRAEDPALRARRLEAASRLRISIGRFRRALSGGLQWGFERITPQGNEIGVGGVPVTEPMADRQSRLTQLLADLVQFTIVLETGPVPASWLNPQVSMPAGAFRGAPTSGSIMTNFGSGPEWEDPLRFYTNWQLGRGQDAGLLDVNLFYIPDPPLSGRVAGIPRVAMQSGLNIGVWIVVPDPDNQPLQYHRLLATEPWPAAGTIFEVWHDSFGYYYLHKGQTHYLPGRPT